MKKAKTKSLSAKEIMKILDIEHEEEPQDPTDKKPTKLMDLVYQIWGLK